MEGPITRLFNVKNKKAKKIAWVHNDISKVFGNTFKAKLKKQFDEKVYTKYDRIIFVSNENMENFKNTYPHITHDKMQVIYNYLDKDAVIQKSQQAIQTSFNQEDFNLLTVARLVPQKAIERFIKVHSKLIQNGVKHKVYIIGDGPEKENLEQLILQEKVQDTFILLGKKENPYPYIKQCDVLALLSYFEGYGMVLEEAKILDKQVIITNTAATEALKNYAKARIVENNEQAIYEGLEKIINKQDTEIKETTNYTNESILGEIKEVI